MSNIVGLLLLGPAVAAVGFVRYAQGQRVSAEGRAACSGLLTKKSMAQQPGNLASEFGEVVPFEEVS